MGVQFCLRSNDTYTATSSKDYTWTVVNDKFIIYDGTRKSGGAMYYYAEVNGVKTWYDSNGNVVPEPVITASELTFTANTAGSTVTLTSKGSPSWTGYYSTDSGTTWYEYTLGTEITLTNIDDTVSFKGTLAEAQTSSKYLRFTMGGSVAGSGNVMSLCSGNDYASVTTIPYDYCFYRLFYNCTSLTSSPELPATTLKRYCYGSMFYQCTSLIEAPELLATTLDTYCYYMMFYYCTSLTKAPSTLPATTLKNYCYQSMFNACKALKTAPSTLPASTLLMGCYSTMFKDCIALTTPPVMSLTTLNSSCCSSMFYGCSTLKVKNSASGGTLFLTCPSTIPSSTVDNMFSGTGGTYTSDPVANGKYYYY